MTGQLAAIVAAAFITGTVVSVYDGDGPVRVRTDAGHVLKIRLRGVQAPDFERAEPCRKGSAGYVCDDRLAVAAGEKMRAVLVGRRVTVPFDGGRSFDRDNAWLTLPDGRDASCEAIRLGAAVRWEGYWPRGRRCP